MKHILLFISVILYSAFASSASAQTPSLVSYQGRVAVGTTNFNGTGQFRFALVNASGNTVLWSNSADTTPADGVPDSAVSLTVTKGLYSVLLGDTSITNMAAIPTSAWSSPDMRLRVWFNDGVNGNQLLTPDQRLAPGAYLADGSVNTAQLATGSVTTGKIATGAVGSSQLASGLTLGGTTTGTFSGNLTGNATTASSATNFTGTLAGNVTGTQGATVIANGAVTTAKIATGAVGSSQLASGLTLGGTTTGTFSGNLTGNATTASSATNFTGTLAGDVTGTQGGTIIANGAVTAAKIATGAVTLAKLGSDVGLWSAASGNVYRSTGNVGIGTTTPNRTLHIAGGNATGIQISADSSFGSSVAIDLSTYDPVVAGGTTPGTQIRVTDAGGWTGHFDFMTKDFGALNNPLVSRLHIHNNGNVAINGNIGLGIGTSTPKGRLHVNGDYYGRGHVWLHAFEGDGVDGTAILQARDDSGTSSIGLNLRTQDVGTWKSAIEISSSGAVMMSSGLLMIRNSNGSDYAAIHAGGPFRGDPKCGLSFTTNDGSSSVNAAAIEPNGHVTIGPGTTDRALLSVGPGSGRARYTGTVGYYGKDTYNYGIADNHSSGVNSIWAFNEVVAESFVAFSDQRIKNIQGISDSAADLERLRAIEITDYFYKDVIGRGNCPQKKVVAQQVEKVFPQAVSKTTDAVPDIYKLAPIKDGWITVKCDLKVGERVKLIADGEESVSEVLEKKETGFRTDFKPAGEKVFVFGREVKDFRSVDYEAISMLNVSATQELAKKLQAKDAEIAALKKQLADQAVAMEKIAATQAAHDDAIEARLARLEKNVRAAGAQTVRASLTKAE